MSNDKPARHLARAATTGFKDVPRNAAWLLSKALGPAVSAGEGATKVASSVSDGMAETASSAVGTAGAATSGVRRKAKAASRAVE